MTLPSQQMLTDFYYSVEFHDPNLAEQILPDCHTVALWGLSADKSGGQDAANRLREATRSMPVVFAMVLNNTLREMGYS